MKDIFNRYNYIIEEDEDETDFTTSTLDTTSNNDSDEEDNDTDEQTSNDSDENTEDVDTDFTSGGNNNDDNNDNNSNDDNDDDNTNVDSAEGGDNETPTDDDTTDDEEENTEEDDSTDEDSNGDPVDIIAKEKELYDNLLSSNEVATRNEELKRSFNEMYDFINKLISIIVDVKKSNVNLKVLEYCENRLLELKEMSYDYIVYNFSQNSYIQNQIRYKKTLFTISKIIDLMNKISHKKEDK